MPEARRIPRTANTVAEPNSLIVPTMPAVVISKKVGASWAKISWLRLRFQSSIKSFSFMPKFCHAWLLITLRLALQPSLEEL